MPPHPPLPYDGPPSAAHVGTDRMKQTRTLHATPLDDDELSAEGDHNGGTNEDDMLPLMIESLSGGDRAGRSAIVERRNRKTLPQVGAATRIISNTGRTVCVVLAVLFASMVLYVSLLPSQYASDDMGSDAMTNITIAETDAIEQEQQETDEVKINANITSMTLIDEISSPKNIEEMKLKFVQAKDKLVKQLKIDYGEEAFHDLFVVEEFDSTTNTTNPTSRGRHFLKSVGPGNIDWDRFVRKLSIKLIKALNLGQAKRRLLFSKKGVRQAKRSMHGDKYNRLLQEGQDNAEQDTELDMSMITEPRSPATAVPFIWSTGGHSASAGHGNFYNQSYTAQMERQLYPVFKAVGMDFVARNFAMGGHSSGPELAYCVSSVYGTDFDVLSWDFGMTDGRNQHYGELYFHRAALHHNRPAIVALNGGSGPAHHLSPLGVTALSEISFYKDIELKLVPDSQGKTEEELRRMPELLRYYRCGKKGIETGDPHCGGSKFNTKICHDRRHRTSWHPGWKSHSLHGNMLALFMVEALQDAILKISDAVETQTDLNQLMSELVSQDQADYEKFLRSDLPPSHKDWKVPSNPIQNDGVNEFISIIYKSPNFCHIAQTPSEIRYKGILFENGPHSMPEVENSMDVPEVDDVHLQVMAEKSDRQKCEVQLNVDHADHFKLSHGVDWRELTLPNDAEIKEYGTDQPIHGLIAICHEQCPWNKCPPGNIIGGVNDGKVEIEVNGKSVAHEFDMDHGCYLLQSKDGYYWKPNQDGKFTIRVRVLETGKYIRITSFTIW